MYSQEKPHWLGNRLGLSLPPPLCGSGPPGCTPAYTGSHVRLFLAVDYFMCVSLKIAVYMTDICLHSPTCSPAPLVFALMMSSEKAFLLIRLGEETQHSLCNPEVIQSKVVAKSVKYPFKCKQTHLSTSQEVG